VVLVSHYDSTGNGHGAVDDGFGLATILEVARAVKAGPTPRDNIVLLMTDGEEPGLLGSRAAVDAGILPDPAHSACSTWTPAVIRGRSSCSRRPSATLVW
jgi:acetylornithine deacetylase/succinyl-diaminopimelate desuccinylase-like protein